MTTSRITIAAIAIALVSASACKSKSKGSESKGTGSTSDPKGPKPTSSKGPPGALVVSTQVVPLEKLTNLFVSIDAKGALAIGVVPAGDRDGGAWTSVVVEDYDDLSARYEMLRGPQANLSDEAALIKLLEPADQELDEIAFAEGGGSDIEPPPPEPDEADDSEPTGETMALDEGKMGKKQAADEPRRRPEPATAEQYVGDGAAAIAPIELREALQGMVQKTTQDHPSVAVVADAKALAMWLFPTVARLRATAIAVVGADGKVGRSPLRLNIESARGSYEAQTERLVDLSMEDVIVRSGPGALHGKVAWNGEAVDAAAVATAWNAAIEREPDRKDVFVSVVEGVTVARLMSVVDALIAAGAEEITLRDWTRPELHGAFMTVGTIASVGDLDRKLIRAGLEPQFPAMRTCYADALAKNPGLAGRLEVRFVITPKGAVTGAKPDGVDASVGACVAELIGKLEFPAPKGGGPVNVQLGLELTNLP